MHNINYDTQLGSVWDKIIAISVEIDNNIWTDIKHEAYHNFIYKIMM